MSHEITVREDGVAEAFYAKEPAWHRLGTVLENAPTSEEAIKQAHLDWTVELWPTFARNLAGVESNTGSVATVRTDNQRTLGIVSEDYKIVQNVEAFKFMDTLVYDGKLVYESAGSLKEGKIVWMLAKFPTEYAVSDDDITKDYILLVNYHTGKHSLRVVPTNVRVVCWNTMSYALKAAYENMIIRHKGEIAESVEKAREVLQLLTHTHQQVHDIMATLAKKEVTSPLVTEFIDKMFPLPVVNDDVSRKLITRLTNIRNAVKKNFEEMDTKASIGTAYGLFNSVTQYVDHQRTSKGFDDDDRASNKFDSVFFGSGLTIKQEALETALKI